MNAVSTMVGFGSIGQGVLPLILRHIGIKPSQITIIADEMRGGIPEGDPCGAGHLHSHQGREEVVTKAVIAWIKSRKIETPVGD